MKFRLSFLLFFSIGIFASGQQIDRIEYYIDFDPGYGNGDSVVITSGASLDVDFTVPMEDVANGLHILYVRAKDNFGRWSMVGRRSFVRLEGEGGAEQQISRLEYFIDADPGYGNGDSVVIAPGASLDVDFTVPMEDVANGLHTLYVRAKDNFGRWSAIGKYPFVRLEGEGGVQRIVQLEYFWDEDPGYGAALQIPLEGSLTSVLDTLLLMDYTGLSEGPHTLVLRARDQLGRWSHLQSQTIFVPKVLTIGGITPDTIDAAEPNYYLLEIPDSLAGTTLHIRMISQASAGVNELYAEPGKLPARGQATYTAEEGATIERELFIWDATPGPNFVLVYSEGAGDQQIINISVEALDFEIYSVSPGRGGNTGSVTTLVKGFSFEPDMEARLEKNGVPVVSAETVTTSETGFLYVTFNLFGVAEDDYEFVLQKTSGDTALWSQAFEVIPGEVIPGLIPVSNGQGCSPSNIDDSSVLFVSIEAQGFGRPGRPVPLTIYFENQSSVDIPVPRRILSSQRGGPLSFDKETLDQGPPQLLVELKEAGGPENILRAGASGTIRVYARVSTGNNEFILLR